MPELLEIDRKRAEELLFDLASKLVRVPLGPRTRDVHLRRAQGGHRGAVDAPQDGRRERPLSVRPDARRRAQGLQVERRVGPRRF